MIQRTKKKRKEDKNLKRWVVGALSSFYHQEIGEGFHIVCFFLEVKGKINISIKCCPIIGVKLSVDAGGV